MKLVKEVIVPPPPRLWVEVKPAPKPNHNDATAILLCSMFFLGWLSWMILDFIQ